MNNELYFQGNLEHVIILAPILLSNFFLEFFFSTRSSIFLFSSIKFKYLQG